MIAEAGRSVASDRRLLYAAAFLRAAATGMLGVLLGIYLARLDLDAARIGLVIGAGLAGAAAAASVVTLTGDRFGRRRTLIALALLSGIGGGLVALSSEAGALAAAAFLGMVNGAGRDRGASLVLDQAMLPAATGDERRTLGFAWYNIAQDAGHALGALLAAAPLLLRSAFDLDELVSLRISVAVPAILILATAVPYARLSPAIEAAAGRARVRLSPESRSTLVKISSLFAVDSLAGGFLATSLLALFFSERFGVSEGVVAALFFGARVANAASHLAAAWLARRIGLVNTMVLTHIPSSLLLATVPFAPSFAVAAVLFLLREGLVEMDVPTRQSYVMAVVRPEERTFASGITNLVRLGGWAAGPPVAGFLMRGASLASPLLVGAAMKIVYDLLLWRAFRDRKPPEELAGRDDPARVTRS